VNRDTQDYLLLLLGVLVLQITITGSYVRYVKEGMQPLLLITGCGLLAVGLLGVVRILRELRGEKPPAAAGGTEAALHEHSGPGHEHGGPRAAWLLALPLLVMISVAPPSLGAYAAARSSATIAEPTFELPPLPPPRDGAVDLDVVDYTSRVLYDPDSVREATVRLSGFVTPIGDQWYVTRMQLSCCAADGRPVKVLAVGAGAAPAPASDTWVEVVGTYAPPSEPAVGGDHTAAVDVISVQEVPRPDNEYAQ
jgi:uncharacterized repeat protein (TIGR03943 family)